MCPQETEEVQSWPPVKQTSPILRGPVSPELVRNFPTMFPPSLSLWLSQLGSAKAAAAVLTSADAQRLTVTARNPPVMSPRTSLNYQMQPVTMTFIPSRSRGAKSNTQHQVPLSDTSHPSTGASSNDDITAVIPPALTVRDIIPPVVQLCEPMKPCLPCNLRYSSDPSQGGSPA